MPFHGVRFPVNKWGNLMGRMTASFKDALAPSRPATSSHLMLGFSETIAADKPARNFFTSGSSSSSSWPSRSPRCSGATPVSPRCPPRPRSPRSRATTSTRRPSTPRSRPSSSSFRVSKLQYARSSYRGATLSTMRQATAELCLWSAISLPSRGVSQSGDEMRSLRTESPIVASSRQFHRDRNNGSQYLLRQPFVSGAAGIP